MSRASVSILSGPHFREPASGPEMPPPSLRHTPASVDLPKLPADLWFEENGIGRIEDARLIYTVTRTTSRHGEQVKQGEDTRGVELASKRSGYGLTRCGCSHWRGPSADPALAGGIAVARAGSEAQNGWTCDELRIYFRAIGL